MAGPSTNGTIGLDITEFERSWREMLTRMEALPPRAARANRAIVALRGAFSALGVSLGLAGLVAAGKSILNFARETSDAAKEIGVLPEQLQRIQAALSKDLGAQDTASALKTLGKTMREAKNGSVEAASQLKRLGVSFDDIQNKTPDEVILKLADHVKDSVDPVEALRDVTNLLGDDLATKLTPALMAGGDAIKDLGDKASVASNQMLESAAQGQRAIERFGAYLKQTSLESAAWWDRLFNGNKGSTVAKTPHQIAVENRGKSGATSATNSDQLAAEEKHLDALKEIANELAPEYVKQAEKLVAEYDLLSVKLDAARGIDVEKLRLQIYQNLEAQRALKFAEQLRQSDIALSESKARGLSYEIKQAEAAARIQDIDNQIAVAQVQGDAQKVAALKAQRREEGINAMEVRVAHNDELTVMRLQTQQAEAQFKGMQGVAEQAAIVAKFDKEIADQLRAGNQEAAEMLQRQKDIAMAQEMAREHDVTGTQRHDARRDARIVQRKARQQGQREDAIRRDAARGARGKRITEQQLKDRNANEGKLRQAQAAADARTFMTQMSSIVGRLASIDSSLEGDA